jgi:hypothetical protein
VANASFGEDPDNAELKSVVNKLKTQNVSVAEADTILSDWLTDAEFDTAMFHAKRFNDKAHAAGLKVVWYYPSLEVISQGGQKGPSMAKTHPDWVQVALNGKPNVFYGNVVFWVDPGDESAWMCPNSPYREYFLARIKKLAATGADGIWPDVPIYSADAHLWADTSPYARAAFNSDTGLLLPTREDWNDPVWRRWVEWRHRNLNQYLLDIAAAARSVNPDIVTIVETVTCDYMDAKKIGLDGAYLRKAEGITHVWEVDVVHLNQSMRQAKENDWICFISMYKYGRGASGTKPAWAFSYGAQAADARLVMGQVLAAGCNPFECKSPEMTATANAAMRKDMYQFVAAHGPRLFQANSLAKVALYHSSASRDYVDGPKPGTGLFVTTKNNDNWWSSDPEDSCTSLNWLAEFRGMVKVLVHKQIPFNVVTSPFLEPADLAPYKVLMLPDLEAISNQEAQIISDFVLNGGVIIITGPNPSGWDEFGNSRPEYALSQVLGFGKSNRPAASEHSFGLGRAVYFSDLPGKDYLKSATAASRDKLADKVVAQAPPIVTTTSPKNIYVEATYLGNEMILQFVNFSGLTGTFSTPLRTFDVSVAMMPVTKVETASPDGVDALLKPVNFTSSAGKTTFRVNVTTYTMVVVTV